MHCVSGRREELSQRLLEDMGRYRHKVFVSHLGWPLHSSSDIESDEFDGPDAVYLASRNERGLINGVARLLPTTAPYLLQKVFPMLWGGLDLPHDPEIWELSRFAAIDFGAEASAPHQASAKHASNLLRRVIKLAGERGAKTLITVSPIGMERLLQVNGFKANRAGIPFVHDGSSIVALRIACGNISDQ